MKTNEDGLALIKSFEGCELKAYVDSVGVWTIGYGHTAMAGPPAPKRGMTITEDEATALLAKDLVKYENAVLKGLRRSVNANQFAAMVSLCYNVGPGNFASSSVLRLTNSGNYNMAADAFLKWNKAGGKVLKGLTRRREAERVLYLKATKDIVPSPVVGQATEKPVQPQEPIPEPVVAPKPVEAVAAAPIESSIGFWGKLAGLFKS